MAMWIFSDDHSSLTANFLCTTKLGLSILEVFSREGKKLLQDLCNCVGAKPLTNFLAFTHSHLC